MGPVFCLISAVLDELEPKVHQCEKCEKVFATGSGYKYHVRRSVCEQEEEKGTESLKIKRRKLKAAFVLLGTFSRGTTRSSMSPVQQSVCDKHWLELSREAESVRTSGRGKRLVLPRPLHADLIRVYLESSFWNCYLSRRDLDGIFYSQFLSSC